MTQPKALRLADALVPRNGTNSIEIAAAGELRRLHAANMDCLAWHEAAKSERDALLEACKAYDQWADKTLCYDRELRPIRARIRAAIKAAEENSNGNV